MRRALGLALFWIGAALAQDRYFDSGGARIRYVDHGQGVAVLLIHGFTADLERSWIETGVLPDLARDHRVLAFDLRGHGKSDKPRAPSDYEDLCGDAIRLMDHLRVRQVHVVGYSLGGIIAVKLLVGYPERFRGAVLGGAAYRRSQSARSDREADAAAREIEEAGVYRALVISTWPTDEPPPTEEAIVGRSREIAALSDRKAHAALMRARRALVVTDDEAARIALPTLAVVGAADPALPRVKAMQAVWRGLEVEVVPGAAHPTVHPRGLPRRAEFREAIRRHIARVP